MPTQWPPDGAVAPLVIGVNGYAWTPSTADAYPLQQGTVAGYAGHPVIYPASTLLAATAYRIGLIRQPSGQDPGDIRLTGSMIDMTGSGVGYLALALSDGTAVNSTSWNEGVVIVYDASADTVKCYTSTTAANYIPNFPTTGTQRGSTVSGLAAAVAHRFELTVSANGNVKFVLDGALVFDGAAGIDLLGPAGNSAVSVGIGATVSSTSVGWTALTVTYP